jgi:predicted DNA-binding protein YlxM (UPF0122 family)
MRKKANQADIFYINSHQDLSPQEIADNIGLSLDAVKQIVGATKKAATPKKKAASKLGRSKLTLGSGQTVYQLTEDIDSDPIKPPKNSKKDDERAGIYRSK